MPSHSGVLFQRTITTDFYQNVLDFWFGPKSSPDYLKEKSFWYGSPSDDAYDAKDGELNPWKSVGEGEGAMALILLLDQVPRNIFRNTPLVYATDSQAISIAQYTIDKGLDKKLTVIQRRYMYSPFNHSENLKDQQTSVELCTELGDTYHLHWAKDLHDQIKRNGRFTHHDQILQRS
ncbi:unnamed protein product [Penicillium manginii]